VQGDNENDDGETCEWGSWALPLQMSPVYYNHVAPHTQFQVII